MYQQLHLPTAFQALGELAGCNTGQPKPGWPCDNKTRDMPVVCAPQSHVKRNHFTSKQSATGPRHNSHPLSVETLTSHPDLSQPIPPYTYISPAVACTCWVPANHTRSEGGSRSPYISGREQVANYKTTLGAWLFQGIAAVLLHAEWGKWACQPGPKLLWWVQMR